MFPVLTIIITVALISLWWGMRSLFEKIGNKAIEQTKFFEEEQENNK